MDKTEKEGSEKAQNSKKRILARGCDPILSLRFSKIAHSRLGGPEYVPTTDDDDFLEKLKTEQWSIVFFAPGACRYSAAKRQIPGGTDNTRGWSLEEYKEFVREHQGEDIQIVDSLYEEEILELLENALEIARETR